MPETSVRSGVRSLGRRAAVAMLCAAAMVPLSAGEGENGRFERDTVWVTNRDRGTVMVFDAVTGDPVTLTPVPVGPGVHDIVASPRTGTVFVSDDSSKVYVLSTESREIVDTIQFAAGARPHHMSLSQDGRTVYVGLFAGNSFAAIDTRTHAVREVPSSLQGGVTAHAPESSADGRFIFVPHEGQNLVTKVSARKGTVRGEVSPGPAANSSPTEVLPTRDGRTLFVAMRVEGTIRTIDLDTFSATGDFVAVGVQPESLILTHDERTLIVSLRGTPARLAFVDTEELALEETLDIAGTGTFGDLAVASPDGRTVWAVFDAAAGGQGGLVKVDVKQRTVVRTMLYPGTGRPHGVAYVQERRRR